MMRATSPIKSPVDNNLVLSVRVDAEGKAVVNNVRSANARSTKNSSIGDKNDRSLVMADEEHGDGIGAPFDKDNIEAPIGVTRSVRKRIEIPREFLERTLMDGEEILGQYDFYYTKKRMHITDIFSYAFYTCGFFFLAYFGYKLYKQLRNIFCCLCWGQSIDNQRGKMIITNLGRVIFWESNVIQEKGLDLRAHFDITYHSHVASIHDLKMMKLSFEDKKQGCYYFCSKYDVCVELSFYNYNHKDSKLSKFLRTSGPNTYIQTIKSFITGPLKANVRDVNDPLVVKVISDKRDKYGTFYSSDTPQQYLDEMIHMCEGLMSQISCIKDAFLKTSAYLPVSKNNLQYLNDVSIDAFRNTTPVGIKDTFEEIGGTLPLLEEGDETQVNIPIKWVVLGADEELVAAVGQKYTLNCGEILASILTFGIYYFVRLRIKTWQRSAIIITNKRLIEMTINQRKGRIPTSFSGFRVVVRSYFPGENIRSGFIKATSSQLISTLQTSAGMITAVLPRDQLSFAHRMHMTTSRMMACQDYNEVRSRLPRRYQYTHEEEMLGRGRGVLSDVDLTLLPTLFEESVLNRFEGGVEYIPCLPMNPSYYLQTCTNTRWVHTKPQTYWCQFKSCKLFQLCFTQLFTCGLLPYKNRHDGIITTHSMYYISCGRTINDHFMVLWVPLQSISGYSSKVHATGAHPYRNFECCKCCTPRRAVVRKGSAKYEIQVRTEEGFTIPYSHSKPYHNWLEDENYTKMVAMLGILDVPNYV